MEMHVSQVWANCIKVQTSVDFAINSAKTVGDAAGSTELIWQWDEFTLQCLRWKTLSEVITPPQLPSFLWPPILSPLLCALGEKPFECRLCGQRSRDYSAMIKHLRTHDGAAPYQCTVCLEFCSSLVAMQRHVKSHAMQDFPPDWSINSTYLYTSHVWATPRYTDTFIYTKFS